MKRILVVNWRWETKPDTENTSIQIEGIPGNDNLYLSTYDSSEELNIFLLRILTPCKHQDECIVLSHLSKNSNISIQKNEIAPPSDFKGILKVYNFSGGDGMPYYGTTNNDGLFHPRSEELYIRNFEKVWNYYRNGFELEIQKKKLINTFLPLLIDCQALSEIEDKQRSDYLIEMANNGLDFELLKNIIAEIKEILEKRVIEKINNDFEPMEKFLADAPKGIMKTNIEPLSRYFTSEKAKAFPSILERFIHSL